MEGKRLTWLSKDLPVKLRGKKKCTGSRSWDRYPEKSLGTLPGCIEVESGRPRHG